MFRKSKIFGPFLFLLLLWGCAGEEENQPTEPYIPPAKLTTPRNQAQFVVGDEMKISIEVSKPEEVGKVWLELDGKVIASDLPAKTQTISWKLKNVGRRNLKLAYEFNGQTKTDNRFIDVFSDVAPIQKKVKIIKTLPHDKTSYTQGLEFYKGRLFEGTGQWHESKLLEVELNSGTILRTHPLGEGLFGEGITVMDSAIYQLTYHAEKCFVYDMDFNQTGTLTYQGQGWGLGNDGKSLIMSNGSDQIVWRDPETFEITKTLFIFGDEQSYNQLNELELIDGKLYVNVYTDNQILEIDTASGKVMSIIDCSELVNKQPDGVDYLNGIAYNRKTGKTYLTGKLWPSMYEVTFE